MGGSGSLSRCRRCSWLITDAAGSQLGPPWLPACRLQAAAATPEQKKLWGGRFTGATDPLMERFNESLPFDKRMWAEDIRVRAWAGGVWGGAWGGVWVWGEGVQIGRVPVPEVCLPCGTLLSVVCRAAKHTLRHWPRRAC